MNDAPQSARIARLEAEVRALRETLATHGVADAERFRRQVAAQSETLQKLIAGAPLREVLGMLCLRIEDMLSHTGICSIMLADPEARTLHIAAAPNVPSDYAAAVDGVPIGPAVGTCGTAAHRRAAVFTPDLETSPEWENYAAARRLALGAGFRGCWSMPVMGRDDAVLGTFAIYVRTRGEPLPEDVFALSLAANLAAVAIEHRRHDEALHALNASLERRVSERTAALSASLEELESFSYAISHDLRAPLRAIDGFVALLMEEQDGELPPEARSHLARVRVNAERMAAQLDGLLEFLRVGRARTETVEVDMRAIVAGVVARLCAVPDHAVHVRIGDLAPASGDRGMLSRAWHHLVENALKFSAQADPAEISIGSYRERGEIIYHIRDNGVGFDMAYADKLFGVFQRLHGHDQYKGTGIGLALVQRIIARHGGRVWCESRPGAGATFLFALPGALRDEETAAPSDDGPA